MNYFDDEIRIVEHLQLTQPDFTIHPNNMAIKQLLMDIYDTDKWHDWIDSSRESEPPPDFYNEKSCLMMEIMRIDDHAHVGKKGKLINPINMQESLIQKELEELLPNVPKMINVTTALKGLEDHNYRFYIKNFNRTVSKHIQQVPQYRSNHPNYKLIFYIFDESSAYMEAKDKELAAKGVRFGQAVFGKKHVHYLDSNMVSVLLNKDIDYLLWHTPFKRYFFTEESNQLPQVAFFELKNLESYKLINYRIEDMMSMEE